MNTVYLRLFALSLALSLTACDSKPPASMKTSVNAMLPVEVIEHEVIEPGVIEPGEKTSLLQLNVNEAVLKGLKTPTDEPISLSDSLNLKIRPVKDERRLSVNGQLLMQETWQANYLDNIVGGKVELQLRFND